MEMAGERQIAAQPQKVWDALNDPDVLRMCIPGCQSLERDGEGRFVAVAEIKIGPIGARFKGAVALSDLDPPKGYTISGQGSGGVAGNAKGSAQVRLSSQGGGTLLAYTVQAEVGGRMAQLGGPLIDATARQMADRFFAKFGEVVAGAAPPVTAVESAATPAIAAPAPVAVAASAGGFPWAWAVALGLAILAGFLVGRSAMAEWWVVVVMLLALVSLGVGYDAGRRGAGQNGAGR